MTLRNRLTYVLAAALCLGACASDTSGQEGEDENVDEPNTEAGRAPVVLATLKLSNTHEVTFYKLGEDEGMVEEKFDIARDGKPLLSGDAKVTAGHFAEVYRKAAGVRADPAALKVIEDFDKKQAQVSTQTAEPEPDEPGIAESSALISTDSRNKGLWNEMRDFSDTYCNKCMGHDGQSAGYAPWAYGACTNAPEYCQAGGGQSSYTKKSVNAAITVWNFGDSQGDASFNVTFTNSCENHSGWGYCWTNLEPYNAVVPRGTVASRYYTNATKRWTRRATITGPGNVMLRFEAY